MLPSHLQPRNLLRSAVLALFAVALLCGPGTHTLLAQIGGTGSLQGNVIDPSGASIPGAEVTVTNNATNAVTTQQTTSAGFYSLAALPPGSYTVIVTAPGFQK